jgi:hypothetical protein
MSAERTARFQAGLRYGVILLSLVLTGCHYGTPPDPNDPKDVGLMSAETVRRNLRWANLMLVAREARHEITPAESRQFIARRAQELIADLDISRIPQSEAWEYAEIFRTAEEWPTAETLLKKALLKPASEDRRVNDTLALAQVEAHLGHIPEALSLARSTFDTPDVNGAPVLYGVYLDLAPIVEGKGHDAELGQLILGAVAVQQRTQVDPKSDSGAAFLLAKRHHAMKALELAATLFQSAGRPDLYATARSEWLKVTGGVVRV